MTIKKINVIVTQEVEVELDDSKITAEFNKVFSECFWETNSLRDHAKHLAQLEARSLIGLDRYVEGYGDLQEMNINTRIIDTEIEIIGGNTHEN